MRCIKVQISPQGCTQTFLGADAQAKSGEHAELNDACLQYKRELLQPFSVKYHIIKYHIVKYRLSQNQDVDVKL